MVMQRCVDGKWLNIALYVPVPWGELLFSNVMLSPCVWTIMAECGDRWAFFDIQHSFAFEIYIHKLDR